MRAVICAAGPIPDYTTIRQHLGAPDLVICADGGLRHAEALGLAPALLLGDFDSIDPALLARARAAGVPVSQVPVEKDETDTHLAMLEAIRRGARDLLLIGGTGGRLDHTLSNLLLLPGLPEGVDVVVVDAQNLIRLLRPGQSLTLQGGAGEFLSLLPLTPNVTGVTAEGVKWPLHEATLRWGESLGVSNRFVSGEARVSVAEGYLLVIQSRD